MLERHPRAKSCQSGLAALRIDQLEGMNLSRTAWNLTKQKTVANCWKHAGILHESQLPLAKEDAGNTEKPKVVKEVREAEEGLREALDDLVHSENVTRKNLLSVEELLDIEGECTLKNTLPGCLCAA